MSSPRYPSGTGATAAVAGHPLHPLVVPFPIAFLVAACASDWLYFSSGDVFWARVSYWLIATGLATGALSAILGVIDFMSVERARTMAIAWLHGIGNVIVLALSLVNLLIRRDSPEDLPVPEGLLISTGVFLILIVTGWLGGELAFRHGIGVSRGIGGQSALDNPDVTPAGRPDIGKS